MSSKFTHLISKLFYLVGFLPPARIVEPEKFVDRMTGKPNEVQEYYLKKIGLYINSTHHSKYYNKLLKVLVPDWQLNASDATFLKTKAMGESSLSTFRKVSNKNKVTFEKIYFNNYSDLKRVEWFQCNISNLIEDEITFPKIRELFYGDLITIVYFDFLNLENVESESKKLEMMVRFTQYFYQVSIDNFSILDRLEVPDFISNYEGHFYFKRCSELAEKNFLYNNIDYKSFIRSAQCSKHIITHGDVFETNVFENNILVDWDNFGLFPLGFDVAFIYHRFAVNYQSIDIFQEWLYNNYKLLIAKSDWQDFEKNVHFFLYVFCVTGFKNGKFLELKKYLLTYLKNVNHKEEI